MAVMRGGDILWASDAVPLGHGDGDSGERGHILYMFTLYVTFLYKIVNVEEFMDWVVYQ